MRSALLDTGFLLAMLSKKDKNHEICKRLFNHEPNLLLPSPILPELAHMSGNFRVLHRFISFLRSLGEGGTPIIHPEESDLLRASELMRQYDDANIDFADCAIIAIAERLNIERMLTVDQRDFRMVRPKHIIAFTILP